MNSKKIVVIGGTGLIGAKLVDRLRQFGHDAVAASPRLGVNAVTGEGLADALAGAHVVVDVANSPSFEDKAVLEFFEASTRNLLAAEANAGVKHHVALSIVGTDRVPDSGYLRAKTAQEKLIQEATIPYTIVRSTQFFEFLEGIAYASTIAGVVHLSPVQMQPIAASDVVAAMADAAVAEPANATFEVAGPEVFPLDRAIKRLFEVKHDPRQIVVDPQPNYFGAAINDGSLTAGTEARLGTVRFEEWLRQMLRQTTP
jgi:uncharacterized protein YbjT (DUF2867 family)